MCLIRIRGLRGKGLFAAQGDLQGYEVAADLYGQVSAERICLYCKRRLCLNSG